MSKKTMFTNVLVLVLLLTVSGTTQLFACSTFQFKVGNDLLFGHNLNEPGMDVPGIIFINKRGILKHGRSFSEILTEEGKNPSTALWISRYGSVTINNFGKDFIDGGINEAGLYIWEMNEEAEYPQNKKLPKIVHMNWMQYVLDNYSTTEEVIKSASEFQIDGWTWHYFISDRYGNSASLEFLKGEVVVHKGETMPVPALFNMTYDREMELLKYYKGFGGQYEIDYKNPEVTRFAKTARMLEEYKGEDPKDYCLNMLKNITVYETPDWSVLIDAKKGMFYFKTFLNPELKFFSLNQIDFSNNTPCQVLDINVKNGGDVFTQFVPFTTKQMKDMIDLLPIPDKGFLPKGSVPVPEFKNRLATHQDDALKPENQYFVGTWKNVPDKESNNSWEMKFWMQDDAVMGEIIRTSNANNPSNTSNTGDDQISKRKLEHIYMKNNKIMFTYIVTKSKALVEGTITIKGNQLYFEPVTGDYVNAPMTLIKQ